MRLGIKDTEVDTETILPLFASVLEMSSVGDKKFNLKSLSHQHLCHRLSVIGSRLNRSVRVTCPNFELHISVLQLQTVIKLSQ